MTEHRKSPTVLMPHPCMRSGGSLEEDPERLIVDGKGITATLIFNMLYIEHVICIAHFFNLPFHIVETVYDLCMFSR